MEIETLMTKTQEQRFTGMRHLVGNTPLLEIHFKFEGRNRRLFAKLESLNMTGSIKDRMAYHILNQAWRCTFSSRPTATAISSPAT